MTKKKKTEKRSVGRPVGSKSGDLVWIDVQTARCPKCQSTDRDWYGAVTIQEYEGADPQGRPFNRIIKRRTRCANCGQIRIERTYELTSKSKKK